MQGLKYIFQNGGNFPFKCFTQWGFINFGAHTTCDLNYMSYSYLRLHFVALLGLGDMEKIKYHDIFDQIP